MEKQKNNQNCQRGITLIALVVTIIVLMIISGIAVATLMGDNGIIKRAGDAKILTERAEIVENAKMDILGKLTENSGEISEKELKDILIEYGALSEDEENILDKTLTTTKGNYEITVNEIYNGSLKTPNAGLFNADTGELIYSWDKLLKLGNMINVNNGVLSRRAFTIPNDIAKVKLVITDDGTVTSIDHMGLSDISKLKEVDIPASINSISGSAFARDSDLEIVKIADNSTISTIENSAFASCESLTSIKLPKSITTIGEAAFARSSLNNIELHENITSIGRNAFQNCNNLTSVKILDSSTAIADMAFNGCTNLTNVELSKNTISIGELAFGGCSNLTITVPSTINSVGNKAFGGVKQVYYNGPLDTSSWEAQKVNTY